MTNQLSISIGEKTGEAEVTVTNEMLDAYLDAVDLDAALLPVHPDDPSRRALPPDLVPKLTMNKLHAYYLVKRIGNALRTKHEMQYLKPIYTEMSVSGICRISDIYERKGRLRVAFEATYTDDAGEECLIDRRTITILDQRLLERFERGSQS
jgi:hypothetical protein